MRYKVCALGLGGILDQTVKLVKDHFGVLLGITGVLMIPFWAIGLSIQETMVPEVTNTMTPEERMQANLAALRIALPLNLLGAYIIGPITNAALVYAVANAYLDRPASVGDSYKRAFARLFPLIWTWFLVVLSIMGGMLLCLVPGILAAFWFSLATQVVVLEDVSGFAALRRSKQLIEGNIGTIFVLGLLLGAINMGMAVVAAMIPQPYVQAVVQAIVVGIGTIISSVAFVVFYFSCRCKHEQFDLVLLAHSVGVEKPVDLDGDPAREL